MLPDGRNPGGEIEPHFASIFVDPGVIGSVSGWDQASADSGEFSLPPCSVTIDGVNTAGTLDTAEHDDRLPQLCRINSAFTLDRDSAETIATLDIRNGKLIGYRIPGGTAVISQLDVDHDGDIDVVMTPRDGSAAKSIRLNAGAEIAVVNVARDYSDEVEEAGHFRIYERLSTPPVRLTAPTAALGIPLSPSRHPYFLSRIPAGLASDCSNTGCCDH
jgi:hypothetical protein